MSNYQNDLQKIKQNLLGVKEHTVCSKARLLIRVLEALQSMSDITTRKGRIALVRKPAPKQVFDQGYLEPQAA